MTVSVTAIDGTKHQIDPASVRKLEAGKIVFDQKGSASDPRAARTGRVEGSSVTLANGDTIKLDPFGYGIILGGMFDAGILTRV